MTIAIKKWGNSQGIRLPKDLLEALGWKENDDLCARVREGKMILEKPVKPRRKTIDELFEGFDGEYTPVDINWGEPVGSEEW